MKRANIVLDIGMTLPSMQQERRSGSFCTVNRPLAKSFLVAFESLPATTVPRGGGESSATFPKVQKIQLPKVWAGVYIFKL